MSNSRTKWFLAGCSLILCAILIALIFMQATASGIFKRARNISTDYALPPSATTDELRRIVTWPGKKMVPCPPQNNQTIVLLLLGQSNAGNHGGELFESKNSRQVVNYSAGSCFVAGSPLLGATGQGGEPWTLLADLLIEKGVAKFIVLVPFAISGSTISRWTPTGDLNLLLRQTIADMRSIYQPTHVLWVQGESDFARKTSAEAYRAGLLAMVQSLRQDKIFAPIYIAIASKCVGSWHAKNDIANMQRASVSIGPGIYLGPDLDSILRIEDRYDGCHLSGHGLKKTAQAWSLILKPIE